MHILGNALVKFASREDAEWIAAGNLDRLHVYAANGPFCSSVGQEDSKLRDLELVSPHVWEEPPTTLGKAAQDLPDGAPHRGSATSAKKSERPPPYWSPSWCDGNWFQLGHHVVCCVIFRRTAVLCWLRKGVVFLLQLNTMQGKLRVVVCLHY